MFFVSRAIIKDIKISINDNIPNIIQNCNNFSKISIADSLYRSVLILRLY